MSMKVNTTQLIEHLKKKEVKEAGFFDKIKIAYRPYICPFDEILNLIPEKSTVFDIGCGSGMLLSLIAEFRDPKNLGGCEISEKLVMNASKVLNEFREAEIRLFDGKEIPDEINKFDVVTMIDVLHHIPSKLQNDFLRQMINKMKVGATLIFKDIKKESPLSYWNKVHDLILSGEIGNEVNSKKLEHFFTEELGLDLLARTEKRMFLYPHFTLVLKKTYE